MKTHIHSTIEFRRGGNGVPLLEGGWHSPDDDRSWVLGTEGRMALPPFDAPHGFFLELECFALGIQRLEVFVGGQKIGGCVVNTRIIRTWFVPNTRHLDRTVTFRCPDATRPADIRESNDKRLYGICCFRLRIMIVLPEPMRRRQAVEYTDQDLVRQFISLGDNCELGLVQRAVGVELLDLLRFSSGHLPHVLRGVETGFAGITEGLHAIRGDRSWDVGAPAYRMQWHTGIKLDAVTAEALVRQQTKTTNFLARKLMQDIADGEKICVIKRREPLDDPEVMPLFLALRRLGRTTLLVMSASPDRAGQVEEVFPGLLRGYVSRFGGPANIPGTMMTNEWLIVMRGVMSRLTAQQEGGKFPAWFRTLWKATIDRLHPTADQAA
jgi:hypothetical protein